MRIEASFVLKYRPEHDIEVGIVEKHEFWRRQKWQPVQRRDLQSWGVY
jgi:hypothetical protein